MIERSDIIAWLNQLTKVYQDNRQYLTDLDSPIGDADHGINMVRGFEKVQEKLPEFEDKPLDQLLKQVGMTLVGTVGGSSGPLYGTLFIKGAAAAKDADALDLTVLVQFFEDGTDGVVSRGKAQLEDKTMVDALVPAVEALKQAAEDGKPLIEAMEAAANAAKEGMEATTPLQARKGRASYLGERSIGHQDPGATSAYLMIQAAYDAWKETAQ